MVVTFPHMGKVYMAVKGLLEDLGVDIVVPPPVSKRTSDIGTILSPEMACLPLKINMGNYIESIEKGADTIIISGSCGPCRFGYYGVVQKEILYDLGYDIEIIVYDPPASNYKVFWERIQKVFGGSSLPQAVGSLRKAFIIIKEVDELLDIGLRKRPRESNKGETDIKLHKFELEILHSHGTDSILKIIRKYKKILSNIGEKPVVDLLTIGLVGEIYTLIEPYVNLNIEKKLGQLGADVYRSITIHEWVKTHLSLDIKHKMAQKKILNKAAPYLNLCIGGHAWQTVANSIHYAECGLDGIIQIMPFGCMPEIVAESILPRISEDYDIPVMTLIVDEMTGEAGYFTRLEAFVDLLEQKRRSKINEQKRNLFRS